MVRTALAIAGAALLSGCGSSAAAKDPVQCQAALFVELYNAKKYGSPELNSPQLIETLKPLVIWYSLKVKDLPEAKRTEKVFVETVERLRKDHQTRKALSKSCAHTALDDPLYSEVLPTLTGFPDPIPDQ